MAATPYIFKSSLGGSTSILAQKEMQPSISLVDGQLCILSAVDGKVGPLSSQTDSCKYVCEGPQSSSATGGETGTFIVVDPGKAIFKALTFVPVILGQAPTGNGSTTSVVLQNNSGAAYNANDFVGGKIMNESTGEVRTITASTAAANGANITFTVTQPFANATATGVNTFRATPLGRLKTACKWTSALTGDVSQLSAELSGGTVSVYDVDLVNLLVSCIFN